MRSAVGSRAVAGLLVLLGVGALAPIWLADPLPLQDLPNHLVKVDLLRRYLAGDAQVRSLFAVDLGPIPNTFCYVALLVLSQWMTLFTAAKLYVSASIVGLLAMGFVWVRGRNPENLLLALVPPGIAYTAFTLKGFLNFIAAEPMYLACLLLVSRPNFRRRHAVALGVLALVLFETHGFVFLAMLGAVAWFLLVAARSWRDALRRGAAFLPALALLAIWAWRCIGLPSAGEPSNGATWPLVEYPLGHLVDGYEWMLGSAEQSPFARLWLAVLMLLIGYTVWRVGKELTGSSSLRETAARHAFLTVGAAMGLFYVAGPDLPERHAAVRWLPLAVLTIVAGLSAPRPRVLVGALLVVCTLALYSNTASALVAGTTDVREYLAGMAVVEPGASVLPIEGEAEGESDRTTLHAWGYYHIAHGGWGPRVHAWQGRHPIYYRTPLWAPPDGEPTSLTREVVARAAVCYDYVVLWDATDDGAAQLSSDFELANTAPRIHVWRNRAGVRRRSPLALPACLEGDATRADRS